MKPTDLPNLTPGMKISDGKRILEVLHVHTIDNDGEGSAAADAVVFAAEPKIGFLCSYSSFPPPQAEYICGQFYAAFSPPDPKRERTAIISAIDANNWSIVQ